MIIKCDINISEQRYQHILSEIRRLGVTPDILRGRDGVNTPVIGLKGDCIHLLPGDFTKLEGVADVQRITVPYKLASRNYNHLDTVIEVGAAAIGGDNPVVFMAGPCAVESREQILKIAEQVAGQGAQILRGGAWKPRTFARTFEGLKEDALKFLQEASRLTGLPVVTEVISPNLIDLCYCYTDIFQVGARNMQNFDLLDKLGMQNKPVLLKRGVSATLDELLGAADRILEGGNKKVMLCLRGVRTFDYSQRYPADLYAIPDLLRKTHLPIIFDPSHSAGTRSLVPEIARMAIAGGVHGLIIEAHYNPPEALCDGSQMITPDELGQLVTYARELRKLHKALAGKPNG
ncbi:MAG: 3-deoxy-7-phosphoheptulonate synthase [Candidatus Wallbacteria bacterium]|nr:3-deoxy-7-phosphoheptulonate synthase [Candidatus Wallbacteria bacterium]